MITVVHTSGRVTRSPLLTEEVACEMAILMPSAIFFVEDES